MESKDELKEINIKSHGCYYIDDIIRFCDRDIICNYILSDEKLYKENYKIIIIYDILCKTSMGAKPLRIRFDKIDGFIKINDKIKHLVLFDYSYCDKIRHKFRYLIREKSGITDSINHNFAKLRINSYDSLPVEEILIFHYMIILIKSVITTILL